MILLLILFLISICQATWTNGKIFKVQDFSSYFLDGLICSDVDNSIVDDLSNFDLIRRFQYDSNDGLKSVPGTDEVQSAYRLDKDSQFTFATRFVK